MNVHSFPLGERIIGLALIEQKLYVLRARSYEEIDVYSTADHHLLRRINISDLHRDSSVTWPINTSQYLDLASCPVEKCLYLTSSASFVGLQRIDLIGNMTQSNISDFRAYGISVERNCNLLLSGYRSLGPVTYDVQGYRQEKKSHVIVEWDWKASKIIREIRLALECDYFLCLPVHLSNYDAVVSTVYNCIYGHRVGLVDRKGDTGDCELSFYRLYGHDRGSSVGQLNMPCHMTVDQDTGSIFVADSLNGRVVLLGRSLVFLRNISDGINGHKVKRVCFDSATRRLYVGIVTEEGGVLKVLSFRSPCT